MSERQVKCYVIVGMGGTGKTYLGMKMLKIKAKKFPVIVYDYAGEKSYNELPLISPDEIRAGSIPPGIYLFRSRQSKRFLELVEEYFKYGCVVFDDATPYIQGAAGEALLSLVSTKRQKGLDVFFMFHQIVKCPPTIMGFCNTLILKRTIDNERQLRSRYAIPKIDEVVAAVKSLQRNKDHFAYHVINIFEV